MVELIKQLNLNRHPRDCANFSLVCAGNAKLSHDKHSYTNEESIKNNTTISNAISNNNIVGVIPTSAELIIFTSNSKIYRYNEKNNTCVLAKSKWVWSGGKIKGTYANNVLGHLIVAVAEYDKHPKCPTPSPALNGDVPLKIIDLDIADNNDIFTEHALSYAISPIVPYAHCTNFDYVDGYTYKGYYEFYIRYKISPNNYTQWFLINGKPLVDVTEIKDIVTYVHPDLLTPDILNQADDAYKYVTNGHADFVSDDFDFCKVALEATIGFVNPSNVPNYTECQLAYVVTSKTYNKCYRTNDITIDRASTFKYIVNPKAEVEYSSDELALDYYNYYNVKQITNYKNRIYIADYKEHTLNPKNVNSIVNEISISGTIVDNTGTDPGSGSTIAVDNFYFDFIQGSYGKLSDNYVPNTAYGVLQEIIYNGDTYILFPLKYVVGDNGSGNATVAHICTLTLTGSSDTVEVSGSQDYIGMKKPTMSVGNVTVSITPSYNIFVKYIDSSHYTVYSQSEVVYFEITPHHLNEYNESTLNKFYINQFTGKITREISTDGDNNNARMMKDILRNFLLPNEVYDFYLNFVDIFGHITTGIKIPTNRFSSSYYFEYTNTNGESYVRIKQQTNLNGVRPTISSISSFSSTNYTAAFLSYRKFEKINKLQGLLYDGAKFTNGIINYDDKVDIGINSKKDFYTNTTLGNVYFNAYRNNKKPGGVGQVRNKYKYISKAVNQTDQGILSSDVVPGLYVANDAVADNVGKESYLWMAQKSIYNNGSHTPELAVYANEGTSISGNLYTGKDKIIIPTTLIAKNNGTVLTDNGTGYNGFLAFDSTIIYSKKGFVLNLTDGRIRNVTGDKIISLKSSTSEVTIDVTDPYMCYIFSYLWDYPLHVRRFKNEPKVSTIIPNEDVSDTVKIEHIIQTIVEPKDSIDLFKYPHPNKSDIGSHKTLLAYNEEALAVTEYTRTIRRSNVLGDETANIGWRGFPVEGYKIINENKGKITNLLGLGHYFFAHTEHSLFMFDIDSAIHTEDQNIQMYQPDVFEVDYKEVFTSDKGYGGLQDDLAWCVGEFGYIFYNNDFNRFYRFDNDALSYIDGSIVNYLLNKKPSDVRFGVDKFNARLLISFTDDSRKTLSYDYELNTFVSWHNYNFIQAFNTKTKVYYLHNDYTKLAEYAESEFGHFDNYVTNPYIPYGVSENNCNFGIDIVVNTEYDVLKMLEFINYDCRKEKVIIDNNELQDRNSRYHPYSGNILRIYNEDCDTNAMDITVDSSANFNKLNNYKKPWYELSRWNFNYFRDKINTNPATNSSDKLRRMHGKYFIFKFIFNRDATKRVEFESLDCKFSLNR